MKPNFYQMSYTTILLLMILYTISCCSCWTTGFTLRRGMMKIKKRKEFSGEASCGKGILHRIISQIVYEYMGYWYRKYGYTTLLVSVEDSPGHASTVGWVKERLLRLLVQVPIPHPPFSLLHTLILVTQGVAHVYFWHTCDGQIDIVFFVTATLFVHV